MRDPHSSPQEVLRSVHEEVVTLLMKMRECGADPFRTEEHTKYYAQVKGLLAAADTYLRGQLRNDRDEINFDGPKFQFFFNVVVESMERATRQALGKNGAEQSKKVMNTFLERYRENEADLRRRVQEMDTRKGTKAPNDNGSKNN
jgi:hypothetical protein